MTEVLYHYTDTARLPWIVRSGELRGGKVPAGDFPPQDFLWATSSDTGDKSASAMQGYRSGLTRLVRFTLHKADFDPWRTIVERFPEWTAKHIELLERAAESDPATWWCRVEPLPRSRWLAIATRSYVDKRWRSLDLDVHVESLKGGKVLGVTVAGKAFYSEQRLRSDGRFGYNLCSDDIVARLAR
jgi:hypothetical protein